MTKDEYLKLVTNEKLRSLILVSESIGSLPEDQQCVTLERISNLPADGQEQMIKMLEEEQEQIKAAKSANGITPEIELKQLDDKKMQIVAMSHDLDKTVRVEHEKVEVAQTTIAAEELLKRLI